MFKVLIILGLCIAGFTAGQLIGRLIGPITESDFIILSIVISSLCYILGRIDEGGYR